MRRGFSLIELLVVVAIIAILVGVATPYYNDYVKESKKTKALQDIDVLKQAVLLHDSQEDLPYQGVIAVKSAEHPDYGSKGRCPVLGENDFIGLQGKYLTNIPTDPWDKNYKLDPLGCFIYSEGPDSTTDTDDIRDYYIKDLALVSVEWQDLNNDRIINNPDKLYFTFNKSLFINGGMSASDFDLYVNDAYEDPASATLDFTHTYMNTVKNATQTQMIVTVNDSVAPAKLGVHSISIKEDTTIREKYQEVWVDRVESLQASYHGIELRTDVKTVDDLGVTPLRYIKRTNPIKIKEKK